MHSSTLMAQEWSFEMNSEGPCYDCAFRIVRLLLNRVGQPLQSSASCVERGSYSCGEVASYTVRGKELAQAWQLCRGRTHDVESSAAMDVNIEKPGCEGTVAEVDDVRIRRRSMRSTRRDLANKPILEHEQWVGDLLGRGIEAACGDYGFHGKLRSTILMPQGLCDKSRRRPVIQLGIALRVTGTFIGFWREQMRLLRPPHLLIVG